MNKKQYFSLIMLLFCCFAFNAGAQTFQELKANFVIPPDNVQPGVYWYFMDGNMSRQGITDDLNAMKKVGIGSVLFFDVNLGIPKHGVEFFSPEWIENVAFIMSECTGLACSLS